MAVMHGMATAWLLLTRDHPRSRGSATAGQENSKVTAGRRFTLLDIIR